MNATPPLPSGFNLNGYLIQSLSRTEPLCHVYLAADGNCTQYIIREFCPQSLAVRDPESGKLRYPESTDIEQEVIPLKNDFEAQFRTGVMAQISALGTLYLVYAVPGTRPAAAPEAAVPQPVSLQRDQRTLATGGEGAPLPPNAVLQHRKKKNIPGMWILLLVLLGGGYGAYHYYTRSQSQEEISSQAATVAQAVLEGEKKAVQPIPEAAFEQETATAEEQPPQEIPSDSGQPAEDRPDASAAAEDGETVPEPAAEEPETATVKTDDADDAKEAATEEKEKPSPSAASAAAPSRSTPAASPAPAGRSRATAHRQTTNMGDVNAYIKKYAKALPLNQWKKQYGGLYTSWFGNKEEIAKGWITTFGPLGFRARGLDTSWPNPNFRGMFPKSLLDPNGDPVANVYVVTKVIEGSPAEKYVKEGDVVLGIDGQPFKTAKSLDVPYGPYQFQDSRGLDMHAGLLVDKAEGAGKITLNIIPAEKLGDIPPLPPLWTDVFKEERVKKNVELSVSVKGGQQLRLHVDDGGNGIGNDGFEWADLRLEGTGGPIPLTKLKPVSHNVGYGAAKYDPERKVWLAHAVSSIVFDIPKGNWKLKGSGIPGRGATVNVSVAVGGSGILPAAVKSQVKNVTFKIPQLGSYAPGFPKNCAKSKAVVHMMSEWLAAQQREDGSWERPGGYCGNHYDTAWAGLALMATGNPKYDPVIKKAAHYIAFSGLQGGWSVPEATAGIFLCEYWLRYRDNSVLATIRNSAERMKNESLYGDFVSGHGSHPGYRGTGVSIGGSHMCLFLALASKTPARVEDGVLNKMMDRAQELCSTGFGPYGRTSESSSFEPNRTAGGTYSGRHGPYFIASLICGGPEVYTKNSRIMYNEGPIGGCDQGHSSETLSIMWALPSYWRTNPEAYYRNLEAFRWKLALLRPFDGGMMQNPNRLELMTADPVIGTYIRTGVWITALCAERQNLAITGKPEFQAKSFRKVPPVTDRESRLLRTFIRNWSMVNAALGSKAPASLKAVLKEMKNIPMEQGCRFKHMDLVKSKALPVAKAIMAVPGVDQLTKAACAEMILGMDVRIIFEPKTTEGRPSPGNYELKVDVQQPLGGRAMGLHRNKELENKANETYKYDFSGSVQFSDTTNFSPMETVSWTPGTKFGGQWNVYNYKKDLSGPTQPGVPKMTARIKWRVNDLDVEYDRPIAVGEFEAGGGEKGNTVTNFNHLWVPGVLIRDHGNWGFSFHLPDGTFISAASQGSQVKVLDETDKNNRKIWISPNDSCLTKGSRCLFRVSPDWQGLECRVSEARLLANGAREVNNYKIKTDSGSITNIARLLDKDATTFEEVNISGKEEAVLEVTLPAPTLVRAMDIKLVNGYTRLVIEAHKGGKWTPVYWGTTNSVTGKVSDAQKAMYANEPEVLRLLQLPLRSAVSCMRVFEPVLASRLRVRLSQQKAESIQLSELHIYTEEPSRPESSSRPAAER